MESKIQFFRAYEAYGFLSNFARYAFEVDGKTWPTSEHYFQAMKFAGTTYEEAIRLASTPAEAARMGRDRSVPLRADWETVKVEIMRVALEAKFSQHTELRSQLSATGDAELIEHTANDSFWGDGGDGSGQNMLGLLLMEVRAELAGS